MRRYHCPKCKNETFEDVSVDKVVIYQITNTENGFEYGESITTEGGYTLHIQCRSCGLRIMSPENHPVDSLDELAPALEALGAYTEE